MEDAKSDFGMNPIYYCTMLGERAANIIATSEFVNYARRPDFPVVSNEIAYIFARNQ